MVNIKTKLIQEVNIKMRIMDCSVDLHVQYIQQLQYIIDKFSVDDYYDKN